MTNPAQIKESVLKDLHSNRLQLPTLPEVALHIRDALQDENVEVGKIAKVVTTDPAICTKLLQVVNSPLYRSNRPVDNIKTAITRLGYVQVKNLVCSLAMKQMYQSTNKTANMLLHECWDHSARVAAIASVMANGLKGLSKDQAILAGLVHDIGKLPLIVHAEQIPGLIEDSAAMRLLFEALHTDVGTHVLTDWNFPQELVDVAKHHENFSHQSPANVSYADVITVANLFAYYGVEHTLAESDWPQVGAFSRLGISPDGTFIENEENLVAIAEVEKILKN